MFFAWGPIQLTLKQMIVGWICLAIPYGIYDFTLGGGDSWDPPPTGELVLILTVFLAVFGPMIYSGIQMVRRGRAEKRLPMNVEARAAFLAGAPEAEISEYIYGRAYSDLARREAYGDKITYTLRKEDGRYFIGQPEPAAVSPALASPR